MARVHRRAQAVARLRHPNLVRMLPLPGGAGLSPVLGNSRRLADFTLPAGTFKRFDLEHVVRLLLDVLSGLAALHEVVTDGQAVVHGHVSPQHIYVDEHGTARLIPLLNDVKLEDTGYTAPELLARSAVDGRADVFGVGVMLWEALAGRRLFPNGLERATELKPPAIRLSPDARWALPLCALAERAIAREPAERFASALELSNALAAAAAQQLSRVDTDAWQEEAPTPVFQPRLHLATLRSSTPPPSALTITPVPSGASEAAPVSFAPSVESVVAPVPTSNRRGRVVLISVGLLALGAAGLLLFRSPRGWQSIRSFAAAPAPVRALAAASPSPVPALAPPPVAAPAVPSASSAGVLAPAVSSASAISSASAPAPVPSSPPATKALPPSSPLPTRRGVARSHADDYGI